jgi:hypothetical protein
VQIFADRPSATSGLHFNVASKLMSALITFESGQLAGAPAAMRWKVASSAPGIAPARLIGVIAETRHRVVGTLLDVARS